MRELKNNIYVDRRLSFDNIYVDNVKIGKEVKNGR